MKRFFFLINAAFAMTVLNLISRVHLHATQTVTIFHILLLLLIYHNLYWGWWPGTQDYISSNGYV